MFTRRRNFITLYLEQFFVWTIIKFWATVVQKKFFLTPLDKIFPRCSKKLLPINIFATSANSSSSASLIKIFHDTSRYQVSFHLVIIKNLES